MFRAVAATLMVLLAVASQPSRAHADVVPVISVQILKPCDKKFVAEEAGFAERVKVRRRSTKSYIKLGTTCVLAVTVRDQSSGLPLEGRQVALFTSFGSQFILDSNGNQVKGCWLPGSSIAVTDEQGRAWIGFDWNYFGCIYQLEDFTDSYNSTAVQFRRITVAAGLAQTFECSNVDPDRSNLCSAPSH